MPVKDMKSGIGSTFKEDDCKFLLEDLTGKIKPTAFEDKEKAISQGINYSEMITMEEPVSEKINQIFIDETKRSADKLAKVVVNLSKRIYKIGGERTIIVSLARAGSPIGALIKRCFAFHGIDIPHYSISIIRGKGIDEVALDAIREQHPTGYMVFVDGWTGKGSIKNELEKAIAAYNAKHHTSISSKIAVLADPAQMAELAGVRDDICIPNACLNSTVSGLVSRTICNDEFMVPGSYHGAIRFDNLKKYDMTNFFLDIVSECFVKDKTFTTDKSPIEFDSLDGWGVKSIIDNISKDFPMTDKNKIKLSIGESSRALLRRKPVAILIPKNLDIETNGLSFVTYLAEQKGVPIIDYNGNMGLYKCITLLK